MELYNFISLAGIFLLLCLAWVCSENRERLNWRVVVWGLILQGLIALFIFVLPWGAKFFLWVNEAVIKILGPASAGAQFVFGRLALPPGQVNDAGEGSLGFILAFQAFPTIIFFSSLISVLYFFNIMPRIIRGFASVFTKCMKISGAESLVAACNIFVGVESALTVRPHLREMTRSELCTVLTAGMATVASNVIALYVFCLRQQFPEIAAHLVSASLLSAPAAILMSKILVPETETPKTLGMHIDPHYQREEHVLEAVMNGANAGVRMIVGIVAMLVAVLGLVALADLFLSLIAQGIHAVSGLSFSLSLKALAGYLFYPFILVLGVPVEDAAVVARIVGERLVVTEVVAYQDLALALSQDLLKHGRSAVISAYALCGFAHLASMAIFSGGVAALVPERTRQIAQVAYKALLAATLACLMTAAFAGLFYTRDSILFSGIAM